MQIRVANRQDEPAIRHIVEEALAKHDRKLDLSGSDVDLQNVESHYFWNDGVFLIAERDDKTIGLLGARRGDPGTILDITRLAVAPQEQHKGIARALLDVCFFFAGNMEYESVQLVPARQHLDEDRPIRPFAKNSQRSGVWTASVQGSLSGKR